MRKNVYKKTRRFELNAVVQDALCLFLLAGCMFICIFSFMDEAFTAHLHTVVNESIMSGSAADSSTADLSFQEESPCGKHCNNEDDESIVVSQHNNAKQIDSSSVF